jgi:hypothetical protein
MGGHAAPTLSAGGGAHLAAEVFRKHDVDCSGALDPQEMAAALQELGVLDGLRARAAGARPLPSPGGLPGPGLAGRSC